MQGSKRSKVVCFKERRARDRRVRITASRGVVCMREAGRTRGKGTVELTRKRNRRDPLQDPSEGQGRRAPFAQSAPSHISLSRRKIDKADKGGPSEGTTVGKPPTPTSTSTRKGPANQRRRQGR